MIAAADAARFLQRYSKQFNAGAFATPTTAELKVSDVREWGHGTDRVVAVAKRQGRATRRRDWTGRQFEVPVGATVVTHVGLGDTATVPDLDEFDIVFGYRDDLVLSAGLEGQGRKVWVVRITAAGEMIAGWVRRGMDGTTYAPVDRLTVADLPVEVPDADRAAALAEVDALGEWTDDYPYYSDGSWSALSLRGFRPDPRWGVKPSEMGRKWNADHPGAIDYPCGWTDLAETCPVLVSIVESVSWWSTLERVRLLRMDGRGGRGGTLRRHTDITDTAAGTRDGQVVRFHVPLRTDPRIVMRAWGLDGIERAHHLAPWRAWYLDARKPHAVTNPTGVDRIHLTVDVIVDPDVRAVLTAAAERT